MCICFYTLRAGRPGIDSRQGHDFSLLHSIQTGSGTHTASYPMNTGHLSPGVKRPGREGDHLQLVQRLRVVEPYLHSPICLHGIVLNYIIKYPLRLSLSKYLTGYARGTLRNTCRGLRVKCQLFLSDLTEIEIL
jgi:hypothetical protein